MSSAARGHEVNGNFVKGKMASVLLAGMLAFGAGVASAQTAGAQSGSWQYEFTPYLWASGMKGNAQSGALPQVNVDASFSDIWDVLDFGIMGAFEARKDRWGLLFDAVYMKLSDGAVASRTGPGPIGATATANANVTMEQTMLAAAAAYRAVEGRSPVDLIGGLRYVKLSVDADIHASFFALTGTVSRSADKDWVDPYIGARLQYPVSNRWSLIGYADVGGFGVGSDNTWQLSAGANYEFSKAVSGKLGYRALKIDYDKSGFIYDMKNEGLYAGVGFKF